MAHINCGNRSRCDLGLDCDRRWNSSLSSRSKVWCKFLTTTTWNPVKENFGVFPMMYGTLVSSLIALLLAVPTGLACAVVLSENFLPRSVRTVSVFLMELLAAIPSIVYGF
jgi:phosphate transport system permease protein